MKHYSIREWEALEIGENGCSRSEANALHDAALAHPLAHEGAANILTYGRNRIVAQQMVGMLSNKSCSLEILPKIGPDDVKRPASAVRQRLIQMLDVALDLRLDLGNEAAIERQDHTLLDALIAQFAAKLLHEVRRGLPRRYMPVENDLPTLRGRLDIKRQFTRNAVRPDRLSCRYDELSSDTPLMQIMAASANFLARHARAPETRRKLDELRHILADIRTLPISKLPWRSVRIDRTNSRWASLFRLAELLLRRDWQSSHRDLSAPDGITLLFPMNDLFEKYVGAVMRKALASIGITVVEQGGRLNCLGDYTGERIEYGHTFQTKPDFILKRANHIVGIVDTKWKAIASNPLEKKKGVSQADIYQMMAYARLYQTDELMLLYPADAVGSGSPTAEFGLARGAERLRLASVDIFAPEAQLVTNLRGLLANLQQNSQPFELTE